MTAAIPPAQTTMALDTARAVWQVGDQILRIREQGTAKASADLVSLVAPTSWAELGLTVSQTAGDFAWTVTASQLAGTARLRIGRQLVNVEISPKLDGLDLFFLADWAYSITDRNRVGRQNMAQLGVIRSDPAACLLGWYLQALAEFATRWLRRGYLTVEDDLVSRVRGRILVPRYVQRSLSQGRDHVISCRYAEPTQDTAINQYLKAGLRRAVLLAASVAVPAARTYLQQLGGRALSLFGAVTDVRVTPNDANRLTPTGPLRHYRPLVDLTRAVLGRTYIDQTSGAQLHTAFLWDLNVLFQEALRNILAGWPGAAMTKSRPTAELTTADGARISGHKVDPDYVVQTAGGHVALLDAKYKDTYYQDEQAAVPGEELTAALGKQRIRLRRPDVYQAVSYSNHDRWRPAQVALVYPVVLPEVTTPLPGPFVVQGFGSPVRIHFLDVGPSAHSHIDQFYRTLEASLRTRSGVCQINGGSDLVHG